MRKTGLKQVWAADVTKCRFGKIDICACMPIIMHEEYETDRIYSLFCINFQLTFLAYLTGISFIF